MLPYFPLLWATEVKFDQSSLPEFCESLSIDTLDRLDRLAEPVMAIDINYNIVFVNWVFESLFGFGRKEVLGRNCFEVSHGRGQPCSLPSDPCPLTEVLQSKEPSTVIHIHRTADNREIVVRIDAIPLFGDDGEVTHMVEVMRDVTAQVHWLEKESDKAPGPP